MASRDIALQKLAITSGNVSCGSCNTTVKLSDCKEETEELDTHDNYGYYKQRFTYSCPNCKSVVAGADV